MINMKDNTEEQLGNRKPGRVTCAYCRRSPTHKAGKTYLCSVHARYRRPDGLLPVKIV
jgi:hypothetical protein